MSPITIVLIVIAVILLAGIIALTIFSRRAEKRKAEQQEQMDAVAQTLSVLIIDKKKMRLTESGLPQAVIDQTPKLLRRSKLPIVKAKIGPRIMTLIADAEVYDMIPVKKEAKVVVSGLYITAVKGLRGNLEAPTAKKGLRARLLSRAKQAQSAQTPNTSKRKK